MNATIERKNTIEKLPIPACTVGIDGVIQFSNELMTEVFLYKDIEGANFFTLTGKKVLEVYEAKKNDEELIIGRNDKFFALTTTATEEDVEEGVITVFFTDITEREYLRRKLDAERTAVIMIEIDNLDELEAAGNAENVKTVPAQIDVILRKWANENNAAIAIVSDEDYIAITTVENVKKIAEESFSILDQVRRIEAETDFPVSISIGVGMSEISMVESKSLAKAAIELALGRGGDQAVVKDDNTTTYYGGTLQSMEKSNRGKSRVIAHALRRLIEDSSKVIVVGHRWPDMDSFGASLGAYRICEYIGKEVHIVIEDFNDALQVIYDYAIEKDAYSIIKGKRAMEIADKDTLLIVLDNNRPTLVECPQLLDVCSRRVVIDHHRVTDTPIEAPTISYVESYASSTSELIAEIMQYIAPKRFINKFEAEALLAGIMVDTNSYSVRSGVRTFEAAAWLKRGGADTAQVKRFFQTEITAFKAKAEAVASAEYSEYGIAYAIAKGYSSEATIINAQVADELLTVKGIKASFVIGCNNEPRTLISARSLGDINVQTIMEKFGGGGHLTTAAAQVDDMTPEEVLEKLKNIMRQLMEKDKEESQTLTGSEE